MVKEYRHARRYRANSYRKREQGIIISLVAVFMLFVMGAMAALSIDVVTFYTARSEAQLAADAAALAGARTLANSGMTSSTGGSTNSFPVAQAVTNATNVATSVAQQNLVGGNTPQIAITISTTPLNNPRVTVRVSRSDLPTFFARIWGTRQLTVAASATAEAYNPSGDQGTSNSTAPPVAPLCVKPWLLPNISPNSGNSIFDASGNINDSALLGWTSGTLLQSACSSGSCTGLLPTPAAWAYYPGDPATTFPPPTNSLPSCTPALSSGYQNSIAGCIQQPISCRQLANIDTNTYSGDRAADTADAVNCLTHAATSGGGDTVTSTNPPTAPFEFVIGADNPVAVLTPSLVNTNTMVSSSLVTVPVFDNGITGASATNNQLVGFVQLFLNPDGIATPDSGGAGTYGNVKTTVINMIGCEGTSVGATGLVGNGASPVAVRLVASP